MSKYAPHHSDAKKSEPDAAGLSVHWLLRGAIIALLPGVLFFAWMKFAIHQDLENGIAQIKSFAQIYYKSTFFNFDGDVGVNGLLILIHNNNNYENGEYEVNVTRASVQNPGLFWLFKQTLPGFGLKAHTSTDLDITLKQGENQSLWPLNPSKFGLAHAKLRVQDQGFVAKFDTVHQGTLINYNGV